MKIHKERQRRDSARRDRERSKKWREKDKRVLFERVKEKYLMFRKMRVNIVKVDPSLKKQSSNKNTQRRRSKKRDQKKIATHIGGCRAGLRSKNQADASENVEEEEEKKEIIEDTFEKQESTVKDEAVDETMNVEESSEPYYKLAIPIFPLEVDWTITLSRNDFPWHEIRFSIFGAKDCYEKYSSIVRDPLTFLKKVLGMKEKYKKMMHN